jgi:hypothetical protein
MNGRKLQRRIAVFLMVFAAFVAVILAILVAPIDREPERDEMFRAMVDRIDALRLPTGKPEGFSVGYARVDLTPINHTATAGYGKRLGKPYTTVLDSIFVRAMVINNGVARVAIVSTDLLIVPPTVTAVLESRLDSIGFSLSNTYLSAVHTHNSIGNWGEGLTTLLYGVYSDTVVQFIADKIALSVRLASQNLLPASIKEGALPMEHVVHNRLIKGGPADSLLRVVSFTRSDSSRLVMLSSTAHATCLSSRDLRLSPDYPGKLVSRLEREGYAFAMFLAGAVGSHTGSAPEKGELCTDWIADAMSDGLLKSSDLLETMTDTTLFMARVELRLSAPQVKVSRNWRLRPWAFEFLVGDYPEYLTSLRIGNLIMLGTPCDFSGEFNPHFDALAADLGKKVMITSFNGGYIGYVTPDAYYDIDHYETQLMNWYGPGNGGYMVRCMERLLSVTAQQKKPGAATQAGIH